MTRYDKTYKRLECGKWYRCTGMRGYEIGEIIRINADSKWPISHFDKVYEIFRPSGKSHTLSPTGAGHFDEVESEEAQSYEVLYGMSDLRNW